MDMNEKNYYITKNEQEYGKYYPQLKWVEPEQGAAAAEKREELIRQCGDSIHTDYIEKFNIQGVSLSGGEPLASLERSLVFLQEIKSHFRDKVYFWLYTNGRLVSREKLILLKEAGLNEIRFNIAADDYRLLGVKTAAEIIDRVTVEIPAVPEDEQRLHYTYLHGPKVTVMESELTALAVIREAVAHEIDLPINYCSFVYKNRFQTVGNRKRVAPLIMTPRETLTESGLIRSHFLKVRPGNWEKMQKFGDLDTNLGRLYIHPSKMTGAAILEYPKFVSYFGTSVRPHLSYRYPFRKMHLKGHEPVYIEKIPVLQEKPIESNFPAVIPDELKRFEYIPEGLAEYY